MENKNERSTATNNRAQQYAVCLRSQKLVAIARQNKLVLPDIDGRRRLQETLIEPYGIAFDTKQNGLWVSDKGADTLYFLKVMIGSDDFSITEITKQKTDDLHAPCSLDFDPEYGLLVACYGNEQIPGSICSLRDGIWTRIRPNSFNDCISHCCWLPGRDICFVTRSDSVLWHYNRKLNEYRPLTLPNDREICPDQGACSELRFRYVQGMRYSKTQQNLFVADASLGAIFKINLESFLYVVAAGKPTLSDSSFTSSVRAGLLNVWLGPIRALTESHDNGLIWMCGETGSIWKLDSTQKLLMFAISNEKGNKGTGITLFQ